MSSTDYKIPAPPERPRYHEYAAGSPGDYRPLAERFADRMVAEHGLDELARDPGRAPERREDAMALTDGRKIGVVNYLLSGSPSQTQRLRERYAGHSAGDANAAVEVVLSAIADAAESYANAHRGTVTLTFEEAVEQLVDDADLERDALAVTLLGQAFRREAIALPAERLPAPDIAEMICIAAARLAYGMVVMAAHPEQIQDEVETEPPQAHPDAKAAIGLRSGPVGFHTPPRSATP